MNKYCYAFLLPLIIIGCLSCDPVGTTFFYINNKASGKLYLYATDSLITDSMATGEKKVVFCDCGVGGGHIPSGRFYKGRIDAGVFKIRKDSAFCKKDVTLEANWALVPLENKQHEYVFTVDDSDF